MPNFHSKAAPAPSLSSSFYPVLIVFHPHLVFWCALTKHSFTEPTFLNPDAAQESRFSVMCSACKWKHKTQARHVPDIHLSPDLHLWIWSSLLQTFPFFPINMLNLCHSSVIPVFKALLCALAVCVAVVFPPAYKTDFKSFMANPPRGACCDNTAFLTGHV